MKIHRATPATTNGEIIPGDGSFDPKSKLYQKYSRYARYTYNLRPDEPSFGGFIVDCEDVPDTLTNTDIDRICSAVPFYRTSNFSHSLIGISRLEIAKPFSSNTDYLYNINYDDNTQYTKGNDFDIACFYYLSRSVPAGYNLVMELIDTINSSLKDVFTITTGSKPGNTAVTNLRMGRYYGTEGVSGKKTINVKDKFYIGNTSTLSNIQSITYISTYGASIWSVLSYRGYQAFSSNNLAYTPLGRLATNDDKPILEQILQYPVFRSGGYDIGGLYHQFSQVFCRYIMIAIPKDAKLTTRSVLS